MKGKTHILGDPLLGQDRLGLAGPYLETTYAEGHTMRFKKKLKIISYGDYN
jgi:hypothetical protein